MTQPFFSVVIPVFNRADVLDEALASVLQQTEQDFEIVVADDGSKDDPKSVVDRIADPRIRYFRRENRGGGAARNLGIDQATGRFIAFLDSDDTFLPGHLATMRRLLEHTTSTAGYARMIVDRGDGKQIVKPPRAIGPGEDMAAYLLCDRGFVPTITTVVPAGLATQVRYHENLREAEDTDFAIRLSLAGCRFVLAEAPGAIWKDHCDPNRQSAGRSTARMGNGGDPFVRISRRVILVAWAGLSPGRCADELLRALGLYLNVVCICRYNSWPAAIVLLQIFLPNNPIARSPMARSAGSAPACGLPEKADGAPAHRTCMIGRRASVASRRLVYGAAGPAVTPASIHDTLPGPRRIRGRCLVPRTQFLAPHADAQACARLRHPGAEYELKRDPIEPSPAPTISRLRCTARLRAEEPHAVPGHPLVWYASTPHGSNWQSRPRRTRPSSPTTSATPFCTTVACTPDVVNEAISRGRRAAAALDFWVRAWPIARRSRLPCRA